MSALKKHQTKANKPTKQQTFKDHIIELRGRVFVVAAALLVFSGLAYSVQDRLIKILLAPMNGEKLVYLTPGGGFDFIFQVSFFAGVLAALPVLMYEAYKYLAPLMKHHTRRFAIFLTLASFIFAASGVLFGYFIAVPAALKFLTTFGGDYIQASITGQAYLSFVTTYLLGLAAVFQLPLVLLLINAIGGPLKPIKLLKFEPHVLLGSFVIAAVITPTPDIANQAVTAAPVLVVYQLGILFVWIHNASMRKRKQRETLATAPAAQLTPAPALITPEIAPAAPVQVASTRAVVKDTTLRVSTITAVRPHRQMDIFVSSTPQQLVRPSPAPKLRQPISRILPRTTRTIDGFLPAPSS